MQLLYETCEKNGLSSVFFTRIFYWSIFIGVLTLWLSLFSVVTSIIAAVVWIYGIVAYSFNYLSEKRIYLSDDSYKIEMYGIKFKILKKDARLRLESTSSRYGTITYYIYLLNYGRLFPILTMGKIALYASTDEKEIEQALGEIEAVTGIPSFDFRLH